MPTSKPMPVQAISHQGATSRQGAINRRVSTNLHPQVANNLRVLPLLRKGSDHPAIKAGPAHQIVSPQRRTKGNKQAAAKLLGLKRTTLVAKLRRKSENAQSAGGSADEIVEL